MHEKIFADFEMLTPFARTWATQFLKLNYGALSLRDSAFEKEEMK